MKSPLLLEQGSAHEMAMVPRARGDGRLRGGWSGRRRFLGPALLSVQAERVEDRPIGEKVQETLLVEGEALVAAPAPIGDDEAIAGLPLDPTIVQYRGSLPLHHVEDGRGSTAVRSRTLARAQ